MLNHSEIADIEQRLSDAGRSVADLCRAAGIAETTWGRWKRGDFYPSYTKSLSVQAAMAEMTDSDTEGAAQ